jgi:hypothetical protein
MTESGELQPGAIGMRYGRIDAEYARTLATTPPEADGPVWMVNLMRYREVADYGDASVRSEVPVSGREADDRYTPLESIAGVGADIVFVADVDTQLLGDGPPWHRVAVVRYPTRRAFVDMQSRPDFRSRHVHKDAGMEQTFVIGCVPMVAPELPPDAPDWSDVAQPPTADDGPVVVIHVIRFVDDGTGIDEMTRYTEHAATVAVPHGVRIAGWFGAEGTIVGDGRTWDQVRFNAFPSRAAFMAVVMDPDRLAAQAEHREPAMADTYTMILRPRIDRLAASIAEAAADPTQ